MEGYSLFKDFERKIIIARFWTKQLNNKVSDTKELYKTESQKRRSDMWDQKMMSRLKKQIYNFCGIVIFLNMAPTGYQILTQFVRTELLGYWF